MMRDRTDFLLIDALQRDGIIQRCTIDLDDAALGLGVLAYIGIRATRPCSKLLPALEAIPAVEECHSVAGELSLLLKVRVAGTPRLLELTERLRQIPGIEGTETTIALKPRSTDRSHSLPHSRPNWHGRARGSASPSEKWTGCLTRCGD